MIDYRSLPGVEWWAMQGLNLRPHPCEGATLLGNINTLLEASGSVHGFCTDSFVLEASALLAGRL